ncbi:dynamin family protein [Bacillus sp. 31A1R]|uniref:Dynamin family protein n=1 Tax=Robertmurraya mangrovi TaxID=3098077 RepID=A0ABU5J1A6_9BACI|nr:dynamin family protein [Bacillus sp. 31A1R]MDZ5473189.1 dynamin family protein [Bacillus sp. 31A1R]
MVQTLHQQEKTELLIKTAALHSFCKDNKDTETANKAKQLALKLEEREFSIAFCGHFSAGKSSMINKLIGENLLPSSPIPTSANLVKVKTGDEYAKVFFKEGKPRLYPAPYDYEQVKSFCKDGDQIQTIEISHATDVLPSSVVIMDTPGIDSTDDAHRIATESALHLADLVFYVMDYNHVQSELNFLFTKELTAAGKEVYLIINQIDKHRDEELSFDQFKNSVKESFAAWGVKPSHIFYTSLREEQHPKNQFKELQSFIHSKIEQRDELLSVSVFHSLKKLTEEHISFLQNINEENLAKYEEELSSLSELEQQELIYRVPQLKDEINELALSLKDREIELTNEIESVLKNAYLMPFQTRELAESYLQSRQPDFKVGLFFSKQKTNQERAERLEKFYADLIDKVKSQLEWHVKELFLTILKEENIHDTTLLSQIQAITIHFEQGLLEQAVKEGARLSGEYVLNYTNDVVEQIKKLARLKVSDIKQAYLSIIENKQSKENQKLNVELNKATQLSKAWQNKQEILDNQTAAQIHLEQLISGHFNQETFIGKLQELLENQEEVEVIYDSLQNSIQDNPVKLVKTEIQEEESRSSENNSQINMEILVNRLKSTAGDLEKVPGFKKITAELIQKAERLENQGFTVALFGAFSAGKSSFANALIGEKLLPVSPNPTTAAINKIMPVDEQHPHGTVKVKLKDANVLFNDVSRSLSVFNFKAGHFDDALKQIKTVIDNVDDFDANEKTHYAFLHAFYRGFEAYKEHLGEVISVDLNEFRQFVANEEKSCLVETIEVYFDCELTRKGITLVDTPGADSINARHTGVAFEYIKNSDAILFVTYYNHAFSKADREFLIQLGRVKDAFELDKMFFVVNAIDLANDEQEMNDVLTYVEDQLVAYGIRRPHLFPISSLLAIEEKLTNQSLNSRLDAFEKQFYSFITHDLTDIAVTAANNEWNRAVELLRSYIHSSQEDKELKEQRKDNLKLEHKEMEGLIRKETAEILLPRLNQESDELTYYIKQRVFLRFSDFFKESFNPSVLKDDGRNLKKALANALDDFLQTIGFDFAQELRATSLRLEVFIGKLLEQSFQSIVDKANHVNPDVSFSSYEMSSLASLEFESAFEHLEKEEFKKAMSYFKNPKSFFEKNEKKLMSEELEKNLQLPAETYLETENNRLKNVYGMELTKELSSLINHMCEEAKEYYEGMYAALSNEIPIEQLQQLEKKISNY